VNKKNGGNGGNVSNVSKGFEKLEEPDPGSPKPCGNGKVSEPSRLSISNSIICLSQKHPED